MKETRHGLLSHNELAERYSVATPTIYSWIKEKKFPPPDIKDRTYSRWFTTTILEFEFVYSDFLEKRGIDPKSLPILETTVEVEQVDRLEAIKAIHKLRAVKERIRRHEVAKQAKATASLAQAVGILSEAVAGDRVITKNEQHRIKNLIDSASFDAIPLLFNCDEYLRKLGINAKTSKED